MPRAAKAIQRCEVQLSTENAVALEALFQSGLTKRGVRYGAISALVNRLLAEYFRANPVVSTAQLIKEPTNDRPADGSIVQSLTRGREPTGEP